MIRRSKSSLLLPTLALALLTIGLGGCKKIDESAEEAQTGAAQTGEQAPGATTPGTAPGTAPGAPGQPGAAPAPEASKPVDPNQIPAVVARVNGQEIKKEDLVQSAQQLRQRLAQEGNAPPLDERFYKSVLDGMIGQRLLLAEAKSLGVKITDEDIEQQLQNFKRQFPSQQVYEQQLAQNNTSEAQLRQQIRQQMQNGEDAVVDKLITSRILPTVKVSEADARTFYDQNLDRMKSPPRAHVRHIMVKADPQTPAADRQKARQKAEDLLAQVKKGGDFAALASANSDDPGSKGRGGDLSWIIPGQMVPAFEKAAFDLKNPNDLSPVVETRFGFHVIQLLEREESKTVPFERAKNQIGVMLRQEQAQRKVQEHIQELRSKGKVETFL